MGDIKVQRGSTTLTSAETSKAVAITAVGSLSSAFARALNVAHTSGSSTSKKQEEHGATVELTGTSTLTIRRTAGSGSLTVLWEIWEYTGAAGGVNEFVVLGQGEQAMTAATASISHTAGTTLGDIVPILTGMRIGDGLSLSGQSDRVMARIQRNTLSSTSLSRYDASTDINIGYAIVEFTGSAWGVQEVTGTTSASTNTWSLGSAVSAWSKAFILASWQTDGGTGMDDTIMMFWPGSTSQIKSRVSVSSRTMDFAAYVIEHASLSVEHNDTIDGTAPTGDLTIDIPITAPTDYLNSTGLIGYAAPTYVYSEINRGYLDYTLTSSTNWRFTHSASNGGNNPDLAIQVVDFDALTSGATYDGIVSAAGEGAATATGTQRANGQASATGGAAASVTGSKVLGSAVAAAGTGTAAVVGTKTVDGQVTAAGEGSALVTANEISGASVTAAGTVGATVAGDATIIAGAAAGAAGAATVTGTAIRGGQAAIGGTTAVTVVGGRTQQGQIAAAGAVGATVHGTEAQAAATHPSGAVAMTVSGSSIVHGAVAAGGSATLTASGVNSISGAVAATAEIAVTVAGGAYLNATVAIAVEATVVSTGTRTNPGSASVSASFTATVAVGSNYDAAGKTDISISGALTATGTTDPTVVIPMSVNSMIERILTYIDGMYRPGEIDVLDGAINGTSTTLKATIPARGIKVGAFLEIEDEVMRVIGVATNTITVLRAQMGTAAVSHADQTVINVSPRRTRKEIIDAIGEEIRSWPDTLYAVASSTFTVDASTDTYTYDPIGLAGADATFLQGLELLAYATDTEGAPIYPRYRIDRGHPTFTSGIALTLMDKISGYSTYRFTYAKQFDTDNLVPGTSFETDVGLSGSMEEIIYYGVLARLVVGREVVGVDLGSQGQPRRAREVQPMSNVRAAAGFRQFRKDAIAEEKRRLLRQWPIRIRS